MALVPRFLHGEKASAQGLPLVEIQKAAQQVIPPLLGGILYAGFGLETVLAIDAANYVAGGDLAAVALADVAVYPTSTEATLGFTDLMAGFRAIRMRMGLSSLLLWNAA